MFPLLHDLLRYGAAALFGFCLGGVLFSYHLPKLIKGVDICKMSADHNPGTSNAFKYAGIPTGILCLLCDLCKGFFPVFLAMQALDYTRLWFALILCAPALGHAVAPLYHDKSGKAIAVTFGALLGLLPKSYLVALLAVLYLLFFAVLNVKPNERCTVITFTLFAACAALGAFHTHGWSFALGAFLLSSVVILKNYRDAHMPQPVPEKKEEPQVSGE